MAMIMENFKHKCDGCEKHFATCDATNPLFAEDRINPMASIPADTVLWCDSFRRCQKHRTTASTWQGKKMKTISVEVLAAIEKAELFDKAGCHHAAKRQRIMALELIIANAKENIERNENRNILAQIACAGNKTTRNYWEGKLNE